MATTVDPFQFRNDAQAGSELRRPGRRGPLRGQDLAVDRLIINED